MAFGFGVGDIVLVANIIIKTIEDIHDAPEELQEVNDRVRSVAITLESIDELPYDEAVGNTQNMQNILALKDRVNEVLVKIQDIVIKYRDNKGRVNALNRVKFGFWDKSEVADLVVKLRDRTDNLTTFLIVQTWRSTNQIQRLVEDSNAARRSGSQDGTNNQTTVSDRIDQVQAVLEHILQSERPSDPTLLRDQGNVSIEREIETQLGQAGIESTFTKALIDVIKKQRKRLAHPEDIDPISYTGGRNRLEVPKGWIMVVDSYNEGNAGKPLPSSKGSINISTVRSIIAQTYLELVRVWTVNNSGEWLFNRVESAGVKVETKFSRRSLKTQPKSLVNGENAPESAALKAISGKESYFRSEEKNDILARIAQHRSRGIDNWHFRRYEYMLCFDLSVYDTLLTLAKCCKEKYGHLPSYANLSKVILIKDVRLNDAAANLNAKDTRKLVESIKDGIKSFLRAEYQWQRPALPIDGGPFRTKQIVLPRINMSLGPAEKEAKLDEISTKTDCRIRVTDEKFDSQLLSITGRREALPFASLLLKEALR